MNIANLLVAITALAAFCGVSYLAYLRAGSIISEYNRYLDNEAIHECATDYRMQIADTKTGITYSRPMEQQVRECAYLKGVKNYKGVWSDLVAKNSVWKTTVK